MCLFSYLKIYATFLLQIYMKRFGCMGGGCDIFGGNCDNLIDKAEKREAFILSPVHA